MIEALLGDTRVPAGTDGPETGDMTRDHENLEVPLFTVTDELITSTSPVTNDLLPHGKDGKPAILCYTYDCSIKEPDKNSVPCACKSEEDGKRAALGCGASYSLAPTEITCCEGHEP